VPNISLLPALILMLYILTMIYFNQIVSDADELPRREYVAKFSEMYNSIGTGMRIVMVNTMYNFRWLQVYRHGIYNYCPYVITDTGIQHHNVTLNKMRFDRKYMGGMTHIWYGGWHCSFCMNPSDIVRKLESFSHQELNKDEFKSIPRVQDAIKNGKPLFGVNNGFPKIVPYRCDQGVPLCSGCDMGSDNYALLQISTTACIYPSDLDSTIFLEYRDIKTMKRIYYDFHAHHYITDVSNSTRGYPLKQKFGGNNQHSTRNKPIKIPKGKV
jgi:hypothetical protein